MIRMLRTGLSAINTDKVKMAQKPELERPRGNSLYALMRTFSYNNPRICAECKRQGYVSFGDEFDHIIPLHKGGDNQLSNFQWLCTSCHADKTAKENNQRLKGEL